MLQLDLAPRRHKRHPLPSSLAVVSVVYTASGGEVHSGQLWDVSSAGACILLTGHAPMESNSIGPLTIRNPSTQDQLLLPAQVCWCSPSKLATYAGMLFADGLIGPGTFLDDYMKASWVDNMETLRMESLSLHPSLFPPD